MPLLSYLGLLNGANGAAGLNGANGAAGLNGANGATGADVAGLAGYEVIVPSTLITNRDGIVGHWQEHERREAPIALPFDSAENLKLWGPRERGALYDFELLSRIDFEKVEGGDTVVVQHREKGQDQPLVTLTRPSTETFNQQLDLVDYYADLRADRVSEIVAQLGPPTAYFGSIALLDLDRTPWTLELLYSALRFAFFVEMRCKHSMACRRPYEYSSQVQPIITTPLHSALPSGHATEAFITASVLCKLLHKSNRPAYSREQLAGQLMVQAARIAVNRTVAGVHFPVDSAAGAVLGGALGSYFVQRCTGDGTYYAWTFNGSVYPGDKDFDWTDYFEAINGNQKAVTVKIIEQNEETNKMLSESKKEKLADHSEILNKLWMKATEEWEIPIRQNSHTA